MAKKEKAQQGQPQAAPQRPQSKDIAAPATKPFAARDAPRPSLPKEDRGAKPAFVKDRDMRKRDDAAHRPHGGFHPPALPPLVLTVRITLAFWVPTDDVDRAVSASRSNRSVMLTVLPQDLGSAWQCIELSGEAHAVFTAYDRAAAVVEEVDDCVLSLPVPAERRAALIGGPGLAVWKRISAESGSRLHLPTEEDGPVAVATLEGPIESVRSGLSLVFDLLAPPGTRHAEDKWHVAGPRAAYIVGPQGTTVKALQPALCVRITVTPVFAAVPTASAAAAGAGSGSGPSGAAAGADAAGSSGGKGKKGRKGGKGGVTELTDGDADMASTAAPSPAAPATTLVRPFPEARPVGSDVQVSGPGDAVRYARAVLEALTSRDFVRPEEALALAAEASQRGGLGYLIPATPEFIEAVLPQGLPAVGPGHGSSVVVNPYRTPSQIASAEAERAAKAAAAAAPPPAPAPAPAAVVAAPLPLLAVNPSPGGALGLGVPLPPAGIALGAPQVPAASAAAASAAAGKGVGPGRPYVAGAAPAVEAAPVVRPTAAAVVSGAAKAPSTAVTNPWGKLAAAAAAAPVPAPAPAPVQMVVRPLPAAVGPGPAFTGAAAVSATPFPRSSGAPAVPSVVKGPGAPFVAPGLALPAASAALAAAPAAGGKGGKGGKAAKGPGPVAGAAASKAAAPAGKPASGSGKGGDGAKQQQQQSKGEGGKKEGKGDKKDKGQLQQQQQQAPQPQASPRTEGGGGGKKGKGPKPELGQAQAAAGGAAASPQAAPKPKKQPKPEGSGGGGKKGAAAQPVSAQ